MNEAELKQRWERDFGGPKGDYPTFEEFLSVFGVGMEQIGKDLVSPQGLTSEEEGLLSKLDEIDPVGGGGEHKG